MSIDKPQFFGRLRTASGIPDNLAGVDLGQLSALREVVRIMESYGNDIVGLLEDDARTLLEDLDASCTDPFVVQAIPKAVNNFSSMKEKHQRLLQNPITMRSQLYRTLDHELAKQSLHQKTKQNRAHFRDELIVECETAGSSILLVDPMMKRTFDVDHVVPSIHVRSILDVDLDCQRIECRNALLDAAKPEIDVSLHTELCTFRDTGVGDNVVWKAQKAYENALIPAQEVTQGFELFAGDNSLEAQKYLVELVLKNVRARKEDTH